MPTDNKTPLLPVQLPEYNRQVLAIIKRFDSPSIKRVRLIAVDEDDCNWRFYYDGCELAHEWNVVYWEYI